MIMDMNEQHSNTQTEVEIKTLSESLIDELVGAVALPKNAFTHRLFWRLFRGITDRLAALGVPFDRLVRDQGLPTGCRWALTHFCHPTLVRGQELVPAQGPLLIVLNHPGTYDAFTLLSALPRLDIKWISSYIPFFDKLPHTRKHILFAERNDPAGRMLVMRQAIKHLNLGGCLVYIPAGHREPDPHSYPGAAQSIENWLDIFDAFFKYVPGLRLQPAILSGMVSQRWAKHPLTWLRRKQIDRQRLAEFGQVISQLLKPGKFKATPRLSFGKALAEDELRQFAPSDSLTVAAKRISKSLLEGHCNEFGCWTSPANTEA